MLAILIGYYKFATAPERVQLPETTVFASEKARKKVDWYKNEDMEKTEMELNIFALATPTSTSWQVQRAQPPIFLSDKLR